MFLTYNSLCLLCSDIEADKSQNWFDKHSSWKVYMAMRNPSSEAAVKCMHACHFGY